MSSARISWCQFSTVPLRMRVGAAASGLDLSAVSGASIRVDRPGGQSVTWPAAVDGVPSIAEAVILHVLVPGDLEELGPHQLTALLVSPAGIHPSDPVQVQVDP
jgi:hypothetical protein